MMETFYVLIGVVVPVCIHLPESTDPCTCSLLFTVCNVNLDKREGEVLTELSHEATGRVPWGMVGGEARDEAGEG